MDGEDACGNGRYGTWYCSAKGTPQKKTAHGGNGTTEAHAALASVLQEHCATASTAQPCRTRGVARHAVKKTAMQAMGVRCWDVW